MQYGKLTIMVVDDQALVRSLLIQVIKGLGFVQERIHQAVDGMTALRSLNARHVDVVLCDISMEPMGGLDLLKEVRMGRPHVTPSTIPFIFLSGHSERQNVELAVQLHADGFIVKPPKPADIEKTLSNAFTRERPEGNPLHYAHISTGTEYDRTCGFRVGTHGFELADSQDLAVIGKSAVELTLAEVEPDSLLMADVVTPDGHLLLPKGKRITAGQIRTLHRNRSYGVRSLIVADESQFE
jgi:CheY-like chemotaxis protein